MEHLWYEVSPYVYAALGMVSILNIESAIGAAFGALLLCTSVVILTLRRVHRKAASAPRMKTRR